MKNHRIIILMLIMAFSNIQRANAQGYAQSDLTKVEFRAGIGGPNFLNLAFRALPDGLTAGKNFIPFGASANFFVSSHFSIGIHSNYLQAHTDVYGINVKLKDSTLLKVNASADINRLAIGINPEYHFLDNEHWDIYAGLIVGAKINKLSLNADYAGYQDIQQFFQDIGMNINKVNLPATTPYVGLHAGVRYSFTNNLGIYTEFGISQPAANIGLSLKF